MCKIVYHENYYKTKLAFFVLNDLSTFVLEISALTKVYFSVPLYSHMHCTLYHAFLFVFKQPEIGLCTTTKCNINGIRCILELKRLLATILDKYVFGTMNYLLLKSNFVEV